MLTQTHKRYAKLGQRLSERYRCIPRIDGPGHDSCHLGFIGDHRFSGPGARSRSGGRRKKATEVREELLNRIDSLDRRVTESREDLKERIFDLKQDLKSSLQSEMAHLKAELLSAMPQRARGAGGGDHRAG